MGRTLSSRPKVVTRSLSSSPNRNRKVFAGKLIWTRGWRLLNLDGIRKTRHSNSAFLSPSVLDTCVFTGHAMTFPHQKHRHSFCGSRKAIMTGSPPLLSSCLAVKGMKQALPYGGACIPMLQSVLQPWSLTMRSRRPSFAKGLQERRGRWR